MSEKKTPDGLGGREEETLEAKKEKETFEHEEKECEKKGVGDLKKQKGDLDPSRKKVYLGFSKFSSF